MSEEKDLGIVAKEEPEEGEIQDDDSSLEDVSSEEDLSTRNFGHDSYCDNKYVAPVIPHYLPYVNKSVSEICNVKSREYYRNTSKSKNRLKVNKRKKKTNIPSSDMEQMRLSSISNDSQQDNFEEILHDYTKSVRPKQNTKDDIVQEKENRHNCRSEIREKRVCRRKRHHSVIYTPEANKTISSSSKSETELITKRHALTQDDDKKRKYDNKCNNNKNSHSKRKNMNAKRKRRRLKKKAAKKITNSTNSVGDETDPISNSLLKRLQTMMSVNIPSKNENTPDVQPPENIHEKEATILIFDDESPAGNVTNLQVLDNVKEMDEHDSEIEILPIGNRPEPLVITLDDSDDEPQGVVQQSEVCESNYEEKNEVIQHSDSLETNGENRTGILQHPESVDEREEEVLQHSEITESAGEEKENNLQHSEALESNGEAKSSKDKCSSDEDDEDLIQLRQLALQSNRRNKEVSKPTLDEEMQLRLAALKSAIIKKCERRKQRGIISNTSRNDALESSSPLSLDCSDTNNSDGEKESGGKGMDPTNTASEPDEITTLVDMDLSHTDDEREADTEMPLLENIPLPVVPVNQDDFVKQLENVTTTENGNAKDEQIAQWDPLIGTYKNSEEIDFTSDNYLTPEMYNNVSYTDSQQTIPAAFPHQQLYQESYPNNNEFPDVPYNSSVSNVIPLPCGSSDFTSFETSTSNLDQYNLIHVTNSESLSVGSEIQNPEANYVITNPQDTFSVSTVPIMQNQHHTNPEWDQSVQSCAEYSVNKNLQQVVITQESTAMVKSGTQISRDEVGFSHTDSDKDVASLAHGIQESSSIEGFPSKSKDVSRKTLEDKFGVGSSPQTAVSADESASNVTEEEDEELLRAQLLTTLARKSVKNKKSAENSQNIELSQQNSTSIDNKFQNDDTNLLSDQSNVPVPVLSNANRKINSLTQHDGAMTLQHNLISDVAVNRSDSNLRTKQILPKFPNNESVTKFNKFSQKYISKNGQRYEKLQGTSSAGKYWKNKKQALTKINRNLNDVKLIRNNKIQNIQQTVQCKLVGNTGFGNMKAKPTTLQVTVPTKNVSDNVCKRKVAQSKTTTQPSHRFVIHLGEDSDSGEDDNGNETAAVSKRRYIMAANSLTVSTDVNTSHKECDAVMQNVESSCNKNVMPSSTDISDDFEKSVDVFLKQARLSQEAKTKTELNKFNLLKNVSDKSSTYISSITPQAVRHLPSSQQEEYRRLKQQIAKHEEQRKQRLKNTSKSLSVPSSPVGSPAKSSCAIHPFKIMVTNSSSSAEELERCRSISVTLENSSRKIFKSSYVNSSGFPQVTKKVGVDIIRPKDSVDGRLEPILPLNTAKRKCDENLPNIADDQLQTVETQSSDVKSASDGNVRKENMDLSPNVSYSDHEIQQTVNKDEHSESPAADMKEKEDVLADMEHQLLSKRYEVLESLTHMTSLLRQIEVETVTEDKWVSELQRLYHEVQEAEERLAQQRRLLSEIRTSVSDVHKQVTKGRSECIGLSKTCLSFGVNVKGRMYKVPAGGADLMNSKLQQVANQTKRMSKKKDSFENSPEKDVPPFKIQTQVQNKTINKAEYHTVKSKAASIRKIAPTSSRGNARQICKRSSERKKISTSESAHELENEKLDEQTYVNTDLKLSSDIGLSECTPSKLAKMSEDFVPVPSVSLETDMTDLNSVKRISTGEVEETHLEEDEFMAVGVCNKEQEIIPPSLMEYVSPLEHFKRNESKLCEDLDGCVDPLAILCPYELMGSCQDEECKYRHQTKSTRT